MNTSRETSTLSKPIGSELIPRATFFYLRTRNKREIYSAVIREFKQSGISQADLARRLGQDQSRVCRLLKAPGNWTLDTVNDLLFAISGAVFRYQISYPLDALQRNYRTDAMLSGDSEFEWGKRSAELGPDKQPTVDQPHPVVTHVPLQNPADLSEQMKLNQ